MAVTTSPAAICRSSRFAEKRHKRSFASSPPEAIRSPSGDIASARMAPAWPGRRRNSLLVPTSKMDSTPSRVAVTAYPPFGARASAVLAMSLSLEANASNGAGTGAGTGAGAGAGAGGTTAIGGRAGQGADDGGGRTGVDGENEFVGGEIIT